MTDSWSSGSTIAHQLDGPAEHASLALSVPEDPGVWALAGRVREDRHRNQLGLPLADPLQVLWDIHHSPSPDADQATSHFIAWLNDRFGLPFAGEDDEWTQM